MRNLACYFLNTPMLAPAPASATDLGDAFLSSALASQQVSSRQQLFVWTRLHLYRFVPHDLMLCQPAAPEPGAGGVILFNSVSLPEAVTQTLAQPLGGFWHHVRPLWQQGGGKPLLLTVQQLADLHALDQVPEVLTAGLSHWLLHGVDVDGALLPRMWLAFAFCDEAQARIAQRDVLLCLPQLYFALIKVLSGPQEQAAAGSGRAQPPKVLLTQRECEVLLAVRQACSNQQAGERLGISPLTVKNHLRNIMHKLGARNRAQAVAEAMARQLIS